MRWSGGVTRAGMGVAFASPTNLIPARVPPLHRRPRPSPTYAPFPPPIPVWSIFFRSDTYHTSTSSMGWDSEWGYRGGGTGGTGLGGGGMGGTGSRAAVQGR